MSTPTNAAIVDHKGRVWSPFESAEGSGYVSYTEEAGEIHIPYGTDPVSLTVQAHELSHVRYTAKVWTNVEAGLKRLTALAKTNARIVGYAEDMRITALAGKLDIKTLPEFGDKHDAPIIQGWLDSFVNVGIPRDRAIKAAQFILTQHTEVLTSLGLTLDTLQVQANAERYIAHCAQYLHKLLSKGEDDSPKGDSGKGKSDDKGKGKPEAGEKKSEPAEKAEPEADDEGDEDASDEAEGDGKAEGEADSEGDSEGQPGGDNDGGEASAKPAEGQPTGGSKSSDEKEERLIDISETELPDIRTAMIASVPAPVDIDKLIQEFQHTLDTAKWIPVISIERKPLVRRAAQARNKGRKLSETGVALGSAYDAIAPNERRPFSAKRKGGIGGLTVLIDCSGSMRISDAQLERLLLTHPQGVVVTYSSRGGYPEHAVVRVIASHGRLAAASDFRDDGAGMNGCDGPVLEWLAKQSGERVWVCDGYITQTGDRYVPYEEEAMAAWLKAHRVTRHDSLKDYLGSLTR